MWPGNVSWMVSDISKERWGITCPTTLGHIPENFNPQLHCWENFKPHNWCLLPTDMYLYKISVEYRSHALRIVRAYWYPQFSLNCSCSTILWMNPNLCTQHFSLQLRFNKGLTKYQTYIWKFCKVKLRIPVHKRAPWTLNRWAICVPHLSQSDNLIPWLCAQ